MNRLPILLLPALLLSGCPKPEPAAPEPPPMPAEVNGLKSPSAIGSDPAALFLEAAKVLQHPRCVNCHPDGTMPLQRDGIAHLPRVAGGPEGKGLPALQCSSCHREENFGVVPGAPHWALAPLSMAWEAKTPTEICAQLKDPARNGNKTLAQIVEHSAHDPLVGWGWEPGSDREAPPGNQKVFGALIEAWVLGGAQCP